ncbi:MAG: sugar phosphate isomerase/epimerase family protein [Pirellulaceae bacterium]
MHSPLRTWRLFSIAILTSILMTSWFGISGETGATPLGAQETPSAAGVTRPFFAFCFDTHDTQNRDLAQQAAMLKQLGFDGAGHVGLDNLAQRLETLDRVGLRLFVAGIAIDIAKAPDEPLNQLKACLPLLKDRDALLYIVLTGYPSRDPRGEESGVNVLREVADLAAEFKVRIGLYPHTSDWVARVDHAVEVAKKVDRPNCGVIFNLCHFLRNEDPATLTKVLHAAQPYLMAVTINGADLAGKNDPDWQRLIQPLDRGSFDLPSLLKELAAMDYSGPIGLMCYGIVGDSQEHLTRSIARWRQLCEDPR